MKRRGTILFVIASFIFLMLGFGQAAEKPGDYPDKPIRLIVPFAAGGGTDLAARMLASVAEPFLGQPVIVEVRAGGGAAIGTAYAARCKPDGYTLYMATSGPVSVKPQMQKVPYNQDSFIPVLQVATNPPVLISRANAPWKNIRELVDYAKKNPEKVIYGNPGVGSFLDLTGQLALSKMGIKVTRVPFLGLGPAAASLIGGNIDLTVGYPSSVQPLIEGKQAIGIAVSDDERIKELPNVPTFLESKYDVNLQAWRGIFAVKGTSPEIVKYLHDSFKKLIESKDYKALAKKIGETIRYRNGEDLKKFWDKEYATVGQVLASIGLKLKE
jgi:tripartite-type tricarboxylate transporter receptor subunit TctC